MPGGAPGIGFDDLRFAPRLGKFLVPGGRSGKLFLVDPASRAVEAIAGFSASDEYDRGHDFGVTSADETDGGHPEIVATDRASRKLLSANQVSGMLPDGSAALAAGPDYARFFAGSVWVTEPDAQQIEMFAFNPRQAAPRSAGKIAVQGGPESLVIDASHGRAYTHLWHGKTLAIDIAARKITATWDNGCQGSRGIDLADDGKFVLVGCAEGKLVALATSDGHKTGETATGAGVDIIAYASGRRHVYAPAGRSGNLTIAALSADGALSLLRTLPAPKGAHCAAADPRGHVIVCDPDHGALLAIDDQ